MMVFSRLCPLGLVNLGLVGILIRHGMFIFALSWCFLGPRPSEGLMLNATLCGRKPAGSPYREPVHIRPNSRGDTKANLTFVGGINSDGNPIYCYLSPEGDLNPIIHLNPGYTFYLTLNNALGGHNSVERNEGSTKTDNSVTTNVTSMHTHGFFVSPLQDAVLDPEERVHGNFLQPGTSNTFVYELPPDHPRGFFWGHPHVPGTSSVQIHNGASFGIIVDGIQNDRPWLQGLPIRSMVMRDPYRPGNPDPVGNEPSWDLSINDIGNYYPNYVPATLEVEPDAVELWSIFNNGADSQIKVQYLIAGVIQPLALQTIDGSALEGNLTVTEFAIPPSGRVSFTVKMPALGRTGLLRSAHTQTGPQGDNDETRPILSVLGTLNAPSPPYVLPTTVDPMPVFYSRKRFLSKKVDTVRSFTLTEENVRGIFYFTENGHVRRQFNMLTGPQVIIQKNKSFELWYVRNGAKENHAVHVHLGQSLLVHTDGKTLAAKDMQFHDVYLLRPGNKIGFLIDFSKSQDGGESVYHCHFEQHFDGGMGGIFQITGTPPPGFSYRQLIDSVEQPYLLQSDGKGKGKFLRGLK